MKITELNSIKNQLDLQLSELLTTSDSIKNISNSIIKLMQTDILDFANSTESASQESISNRTLSYSLNQIYNEFYPTKKIAFLVHDPMMLVHYGDVWKAIGNTNFTIVLSQYFACDVNGIERLGVSDFFTHVNTMGYEVKKIIDIISCGIKFDYVVTNHVISGSTVEIKQESEEDSFKKLLNRGLLLQGQDLVWTYEVDIDTYLPLQIGIKQIRYMYGADISDGWSLSNWNSIYDVFLCHGVNDAREIQKRFDGKVFIMGYPRYDRFFSQEMNYTKIKSEFEISDSKKTILWMPTLEGEYESSIPLFSEALFNLRNDFNIIVRPHPLSFVQEKDYILILEKHEFKIDKNALRDMNELYGVADIVLVDNGGSAFSAIFLEKNLAFLEVAKQNVFSKDYVSSIEEIKKNLPTFLPEEISLFPNIFNSENFYTTNTQQVKLLFKKYFNSSRGNGAETAATILKNL